MQRGDDLGFTRDAHRAHSAFDAPDRAVKQGTDHFSDLGAVFVAGNRTLYPWSRPCDDPHGRARRRRSCQIAQAVAAFIRMPTNGKGE